MSNNVYKKISEYIFVISREGVPNGHLYAALMEQGVEFEEYMIMLACLKKLNLIEEKFNFLSLTESGVKVLTELEKIVAASRKS